MADVKGTIESVDSAAKSMTSSVEEATAAVEKLSKSMVTGGRGFEDLVSSIKHVGSATESAALSVGKLVGAFPLLGGAGEIVSKLGSSMGGLASIVGELGSTYAQSLNLLDSFSSGLREMDKDLFELGSAFGTTLEEARSFTEYIGRSARMVSQEQFGYINISELNEFSEGLMRSRISMERQMDTVVSSAGSMDLLTSAILQAGASGLQTSDFLSKLGDAIMRQGLDSQAAAEQLASFRAIADETGLTSENVADNLNSLANNFSKLGLSADFGRSLLVGFARTMDDMGLGIENALGLSSDLSSALAGLATDYSTAFITAQRGGLDLGTGSVLGAGIQLQARMLQAQQTGDEAQQAELARDLAGGLRDTIASFAGGQIVTVEQAAAGGPGLEAAFFTQSKLLEDMYGLDQQSAARTLDLLSNLDESVRVGDQEAADELARQVEESIKSRDENLALLDKQNALTAALLAETAVQTRALMFLPRAIGAEALLDPAGEQIAAGFGEFQARARTVQRETLDKIAEGTGKTDSLLSSISGLFREQQREYGDIRAFLTSGVVEANTDGGVAPGVAAPATAETERTDIPALIAALEGLTRELRRTGIGGRVARAAGTSGYEGNQ